MNLAHYFDSSAVLAMLFQQEVASDVLGLWETSSYRVSSFLTYFECVNVNSRYCAGLPVVNRQKWGAESSRWIDNAMRSLSLHEVNASVLERLKRESKLVDARTLDAIHLATALIFQDAGVQVELVTFDERMRKCASQLGLSVLPSK